MDVGNLLQAAVTLLALAILFPLQVKEWGRSSTAQFALARFVTTLAVAYLVATSVTSALALATDGTPHEIVYASLAAAAFVTGVTCLAVLATLILYPEAQAKLERPVETAPKETMKTLAREAESALSEYPPWDLTCPGCQQLVHVYLLQGRLVSHGHEVGCVYQSSAQQILDANDVQWKAA